MISGFIDSPYNFKKVLREIEIMRQLTNMKGNIFTTMLYDLIVPEEEDFKHVFLVMDY